MFRDYFGALATGRIGRGRFVLLTVALVGLLLAAMIVLVTALGFASDIFSGDLDAASSRLAASVGVPAVVGLVAIGLGVTFANANIVAKRARDMGLPGWPVAVVHLILSGGATQAGEGTAGLGLVLFVLLALVPSGQFARRGTAG